jgi:hypothetical protein
MEYEDRGTAAQAEVASPYAKLETLELVDLFYERDADPAVGQEIAVRYFEHAGFTDDSRTTPLIGRDGKQVQEDGRQLFLVDYINYAAKHHSEALDSILSFLLMRPGEQDYEDMRASILARLKASRG